MQRVCFNCSVLSKGDGELGGELKESATKSARLNHLQKLEHMYLMAPINAFYSPRISISQGEAEITIPVKPEFFHAADAVHGSVYFKLLDDAAFFAVNSLMEDYFALTASFTTCGPKDRIAGIAEQTHFKHTRALGAMVASFQVASITSRIKTIWRTAP
jgi:acyl-coenzyme A thioesterase PaaI-like protein